MRGVGRREVGHGNLAMRSLRQMMPGSDYPYTVRIVSDILESNGSSSMATVCAGSLALMDAGVPIPKHVAGVAMGLITKEGKFAVLTDILGDEDHLGDMDFKVTGTRDGICGIQMDIKVDGLSMDVMRAALAQAGQRALRRRFGGGLLARGLHGDGRGGERSGGDEGRGERGQAFLVHRVLLAVVDASGKWRLGNAPAPTGG